MWTTFHLYRRARIEFDAQTWSNDCGTAEENVTLCHFLAPTVAAVTTTFPVVFITLGLAGWAGVDA